MDDVLKEIKQAEQESAQMLAEARLKAEEDLKKAKDKLQQKRQKEEEAIELEMS